MPNMPPNVRQLHSRDTPRTPETYVIDPVIHPMRRPTDRDRVAPGRRTDGTPGQEGPVAAGNRQGVGGAYVYTPAIGEQEFVAKRLADILSAIERDEPAALAQYLGARSVA
jgi:hypothetical protein